MLSQLRLSISVHVISSESQPRQLHHLSCHFQDDSKNTSPAAGLGVTVQNVVIPLLSVIGGIGGGVVVLGMLYLEPLKVQQTALQGQQTALQGQLVAQQTQLQGQLTALQTQQQGQFAQLLERLDKVPELSGQIAILKEQSGEVLSRALK